MLKLTKLKEKFTQFGVIKTDTEYHVDDDKHVVVQQTKYYRVPNVDELIMERIAIVWSFYAKKFTKHASVHDILSKLSLDGDIERSTNLKILIDVRETMDERKESRDITGMVDSARTMYGMLTVLGYKKGPHKLDEWTHINMTEEARSLLIRYNLIPKPAPKAIEPPVEETVEPTESAPPPSAPVGPEVPALGAILAEALENRAESAESAIPTEPAPPENETEVQPENAAENVDEETDGN